MSILNTRDKEFAKAKLLYEEYKDTVQSVAESLGLFDASSENYPLAEQNYSQWEKARLNEVYEYFNKDYLKYIKDEKYFFGCSLNVYKEHLESRKKLYYEASDNTDEVGFILNELAIGKLDFDHGICDTDTVNILDINLKLRYNLLLNRLTELGYDTEGILDINRAAKPKVSAIESEIDLSDTNRKEKVIYLNELGIIQHIKTHFRKANLSHNQIAGLLSAITGVQQRTMQSYINPLLNKGNKIVQSNNPYTNQENVDSIRTILKTDFHLDLPDKV
jgi:hypothetical protein